MPWLIIKQAGAGLLAEIEEHRLLGHYEELRAASHTLPSSSVQNAQCTTRSVIVVNPPPQYTLYFCACIHDTVLFLCFVCGVNA